MITIFGGFRQFSAKKWRFSKKNNVMIQTFFLKIAVFCTKNGNFFGENVLKFITSVPGMTSLSISVLKDT
jgi:hypothetical protein